MSTAKSFVESNTGTTNPDGSVSNITTSGNVVHSNDPTTRPDAPASEKLKGDFKGAISGSVGSIQAATGAMLGKKDMQEKGQAKMAEEDQRLAAKQGVPPVGSETRGNTGEPASMN